MKTTKATIIKLINVPRKAPHPITIGPNEKVAVCQAPFGIKGVIIGIIILFTNDCIKLVAATPVMNAIANPTTLYSFKNSLNSVNKPIFIKNNLLF